ncbi:hypothetical protein Tsubulata_043069 [Turnera subulata]|uniref:F-box domain-containing protein n=1 Tax=Turnera subulata TaxID=218843 RepID=A0A9Q0FB09_9ROSI|nr:hypothetical protein Tsubulata_043069 [Turnera subulata]
MANSTLPSVIVEEILAMLPNKSIHRFRQVSKSWSSFLVSSEFQKLRTNKSTPAETNLQKILQCSAVNDGYVIESIGCLGDGEDPVRLQFPTDKKLGENDHDRRICACGFGYDSVADDYKEVETTDPGKDLEYVPEEHELGLLFNGAPHWQVLIVGKTKIIAFDLAKEKFYDVPVPLRTDSALENNVRRSERESMLKSLDPKGSMDKSRAILGFSNPKRTST